MSQSIFNLSKNKILFAQKTKSDQNKLTQQFIRLWSNRKKNKL